MISREELIKRGARYVGGAPVTPDEPKKEDPAPSAPLVGETKIDMTPIAEAVNQLSAVVKTALEAQRPILEKIVENQSQVVEPKKPPEAWEFKIIRDSRGKMDSIKAVAIG